MFRHGVINSVFIYTLNVWSGKQSALFSQQSRRLDISKLTQFSRGNRDWVISYTFRGSKQTKKSKQTNRQASVDKNKIFFKGISCCLSCIFWIICSKCSVISHTVEKRFFYLQATLQIPFRFQKLSAGFVDASYENITKYSSLSQVLITCFSYTLNSYHYSLTNVSRAGYILIYARPRDH